MTILLVIAVIAIYVIGMGVAAGVQMRLGDDDYWEVSILWPVIVPFAVVALVIWVLLALPAKAIATRIAAHGTEDKKPPRSERLLAWLNREHIPE